MMGDAGSSVDEKRVSFHKDAYLTNLFDEVKIEKQIRGKERSSDSSTVLLSPSKRPWSSKRTLLLGVAVALVLAFAAGLLLLVLSLLLPPRHSSATDHLRHDDHFVMTAPDVVHPLPPTASVLGQFRSAAVVSNGQPCAKFGKQMLQKGGSAVDAAIATMLCDGAACLHNMGLGGGFVMVIYDRAKRAAQALDARESAPAAATRDMFHANASLSTVGGLSVAVPGELRGYQAAWEQYGRVQWHELFEPTIRLCEEGVMVGAHLAASLRSKEHEIRASPTLRKILIHQNGRLPQMGDKIKLPLLAQTLRKVAYSPLKADELYNGSFTDSFVKDIQKEGGIITKQDMIDYKVRWKKPVVADLSDGLRLHSMPPPGSGLLLAFVMRVLDGFVKSGEPGEPTVVQRITEAFKHAFGRRTDIADPDFQNITKVVKELSSDEYVETVRDRISDNSTSQDPRWYGAHFDLPEDHGTANIVVLAEDGSAVAATSTVNLLFGSQIASLSTGIILNDEMDDFSAPALTNFFGVPPSPANFIEPGKRPMSSMCPTVVTDEDGDVRLVVGSAGGTKITTSTALVTILNLWFDKNIKEAIDYPRFHHQLIPMEFAYEYGLVKDVVDGMKRAGHFTRRLPIAWRSCVTAIARNGSHVQSNSDHRRPGLSAGY